MTSYPSKVVAAYAVLNWGMRDVKISSPCFFSAISKDKRTTFCCSVQDHNNATIDIPTDVSESEYMVFCIPNKQGANLIVLDSRDLKDRSGDNVSFEWLADKIKRKDRIEFKKL